MGSPKSGPTAERDVRAYLPVPGRPPANRDEVAKRELAVMFLDLATYAQRTLRGRS